MENITLHIFGNGEVQLICGENGINKKKNFRDLTKLDSFINHVFSKKPSDNNSENKIHCIHVIKNSFVQFIPSEKKQKSFRFSFSDLDNELFEELINEVLS